MTSAYDHPCVTLIFGQSGAGITTALNVMQDLGFLVMDNFPLHLISQCLDDPWLKNSQYRGFAFGLHAHLATQTQNIHELIQSLSARVDLDIIFLACGVEVLEQRFSVTRRPHPFLKQSSLHESIAHEDSLTKPLKEAAHEIIDTTHLDPLALGNILRGRFRDQNRQTPLLLILKSFGFKQHLILPGDTVFDVRFLKNPFFDPSLSELNGLDPQVRDYIKSDPAYAPLMNHLTSLLNYTISLCQDEHRGALRVAVGCTGGIHRSVTVIEDLKVYFNKSSPSKEQILVHTHHISLTPYQRP